jgi:RNA polymerase sigma-70 factor (ECF subfamily)
LQKSQKYKLYTDEELISQIMLNNDPNSVGELYKRYGHLVFGVGLKILKNKEDSEDLTSTLFMTLQKKIQKQEIKYFKSWLYKVTLNECYMLLRKKQPYFESELSEGHLFILQNDTQEPSDIDCFQSNIDRGIEQLKPDHRIAIQLFYQSEKSYFEISQEMGWELKSVKSKIQNAKRNLKIILQNLCDGK